VSNSKRTQIPVYSFEKHARLESSTVIYSPHVLILEGIFALHDPRVLELMDMRVTIPSIDYHAMRLTLTDLQIYCEADADTCLSRRSKSHLINLDDDRMLMNFASPP